MSEAFDWAEEPTIFSTNGESQLDELSAASELLDQLHDYGEAAEDSDESTAGNINSIGDVRQRMHQKRFTWYGYDESIMPAEYMEVIWHPLMRTQTAEEVTEIIVRHPRLSGEEFSMFGQERQTPNDIFIAVDYKDGPTGKYLLNNQGLVAYSEASSIEFSDAEMFDYDKLTTGDRPNVFSVSGLQGFVPPLSAVALRRMLLEESTFEQREQPDV